MEVMTDSLLSAEQFSQIAGLKVSTLHYYDRRGLFSPAGRKLRGRSENRQYALKQMQTGKMINILKIIGVPLKTIEHLSRNRTPESVLRELRNSKDEIRKYKRYLNEAEQLTDVYIGQLTEGMSITEGKIHVTEMPKRKFTMGDINDFTDYDDFYGEFLRFYGSPNESILHKCYPVGGYWNSMAEFIESPSRPMRFFSLNPSGQDCRDEGLYLNGYTRGNYSVTNDLPERMMSYAIDNGLEFSGPVYNTYLFDELSVADPDRYLLQVSAAVVETGCTAESFSYRQLSFFTDNQDVK